jgi:hypothetical protein
MSGSPNREMLLGDALIFQPMAIVASIFLWGWIILDLVYKAVIFAISVK